MGERRPVLHTAEWIARLIFTPQWGNAWGRNFIRRIAHTADERGIRKVDMD